MTYFHGTNADLQIGELLIPGSLLSVSANHGRSNHVYMTSDASVSRDFAVSEAYAWARTACMVAEDEGAEEEPQAYVYIVEPSADVEADGGEDVGEESVRSSSAVIVGVVDGYDLYEIPVGFGSKYLNL